MLVMVGTCAMLSDQKTFFACDMLCDPPRHTQIKLKRMPVSVGGFAFTFVRLW